MIFFFIWDAGEDSLKKFIEFCDSYSRLKGMKSNIRFESNVSPETVNFLDVNVQLINNKLKTTLHTKATDAHLYLNAKSCHPNHVIRNIPKGQLIRVRRICSDINDYDLNSNKMIRYFISRGYKQVHLENIQLSVRNMYRKDLLNSEKSDNKDSNTVFICTWHPTLAKLPSLPQKITTSWTTIQN